MERMLRTAEGPGREEGRAPLQARWSGHASGSVRVAYRAAAPAVIQLCGGEDWKTVQRLLRESRHCTVSESDARSMIDRIRDQIRSNPGQVATVSIPGHYVELHYSPQRGYYTSKTRPPGFGPMGRLAEEGGVPVDMEELAPGQDDDYITRYPQFTQSTTVTRQGLSHIQPRQSLNQVMGGSAADLTGIPGSEHLHMIAHSLGGQESAENVAEGPHGLNTAMMPIEHEVKTMVMDGYNVSYRVTGFPRPGTRGLWTSEMHLSISIEKDGRKFERSVRLSMPGEVVGRLSQESYNEILGLIQTQIQQLKASYETPPEEE